MVINRLQYFFGPEPEHRPPNEDYFIVAGEGGCFFVARETARDIVRILALRRQPRWIIFRDLAGSEIRVQPRRLIGVYESTAEQRARERAFMRARLLEAQRDDRAWEEDE